MSARCSDHGSIDNGRTTDTAPYHQGTSVTYHCDDGYTMTGDNTLTCQSNGAWDKPAPTCDVPGKANIFLYFSAIYSDPGSIDNGKCRGNTSLYCNISYPYY